MLTTTTKIQKDHQQRIVEMEDAVGLMDALNLLDGDAPALRRMASDLKLPFLRHLSDLFSQDRCARGELLDAFEAQKSFAPRAVTLTRATPSVDPHSYINLLTETRKIVSRELRTGFLRSPGTGAVVASHLQNNIHVHLLYWGPDLGDLPSKWLTVTGDSDQVDVQVLKKPKDVERWAGYIVRQPTDDAAQLVARCQVLGRRRLLEKYGCYREPRKGCQNRVRSPTPKTKGKTRHASRSHNPHE